MRNTFQLRFLLIGIGLILLIVCAYEFLPVGVDWDLTYRPATLALLQGHSPFSVDVYYAVPWAVIPLIPFALLPIKLGRAVLFIVGIVVFLFTAIKLGGKKVAVTAFLCSPPVIHCLYNSNIEWMPILGFILPPQIGLFFVATKPQIGVGIALYWVYDSWKTGGIWEVFRVFAPFTIVMFLSFWIFGLWPLRFQDTLTLTAGYNSSIWPYGIPLGLLLLIRAMRGNDPFPAMASSPFFSPYVLLHAYSGALISVIRSNFVTVSITVLLWGLVILQALKVYPLLGYLASFVF